MATNKNAIVRYRALDKCFSSRTRKYYMNDLIEACRMALERQNGDSGSSIQSIKVDYGYILEGEI